MSKLLRTGWPRLFFLVFCNESVERNDWTAVVVERGLAGGRPKSSLRCKGAWSVVVLVFRDRWLSLPFGCAAAWRRRLSSRSSTIQNTQINAGRSTGWEKKFWLVDCPLLIAAGWGNSRVLAYSNRIIMILTQVAVDVPVGLKNTKFRL